jgi:hypothetical protein
MSRLTQSEQSLRRGRRVELQLSVGAARELERLAGQGQCSQSEIVEGLVLGTIQRVPVSAEVVDVMVTHGMGLEEAIAFLERRT